MYDHNLQSRRGSMWSVTVLHFSGAIFCSNASSQRFRLQAQSSWWCSFTLDQTLFPLTVIFRGNLWLHAPMKQTAGNGLITRTPNGPCRAAAACISMDWATCLCCACTWLETCTGCTNLNEKLGAWCDREGEEHRACHGSP